MTAQFIINDGQHRRAAIEVALREDPALAGETIGIVFFMDIGLKRSQQMFADLNRHAVRPSKSLGVLYDHRDPMAEITRLAVFKSPFFRDLVEVERSTLALRSRKLLTLSSIHTGTQALLGKPSDTEALDVEFTADQVRMFWEEVAQHFREWQLVHDRKLAAAEVRAEFIHSHAIVLHALGNAGRTLRDAVPEGWKDRLIALGSVDWSRANTDQWEGRAMTGGRVAKSRQNVALTTNAIKQVLGLPLTPEEQRTEDGFTRARRPRR
jgi:DNA sulfur modification protein DndB